MPAVAADTDQAGSDPAERVVRFFERHLRHQASTSKTAAGDPFVLEKWQRDDIIRPLFGTLDRHGRRVYREALIGLPRKNGKSALASGLALYGLFGDGEYGAEVYSLAGSKQQARRVFDEAKKMVQSSPLLRAASRVYRDAIEVPETASVFRVLSSDAGLQHGLNPSFAVVDELHVHKSPELYEAIRTGILARREPMVINISTAGARPKGVLWDLYRRGQAGGDPRLFTRWWGVPDDADWTDTKTWRAANPASWVTVPLLRDLKRAMPEPVFRQLHLNQWVSAQSSWVTRSVWDAGKAAPNLDPDRPVWVALDGAYARDTTAIVLVQRDDKDVYHAACWVWDPADSPDGFLDYADVEDFIRGLFVDWQVERFVADRFSMVRTIKALNDEGIPIEEFRQSNDMMVPASQALLDVVTEGRLRHGGDPVLTEHAMGATVRRIGGAWRLDKPSKEIRIDAVVALAMALRVAELDRDAGRFYSAVV